MYLCLNRMTVKGGLSDAEFLDVARDAGYDGADVPMHLAMTKPAAAIGEMFASRNLRFGGWGPGEWRKDEATLQQTITSLHRQASAAAALGVDACATWIMPSSERPFIETWNFHVQRLTPVARALGEHGLRLGLEFVAPHGARTHFPHEFVFTPGLMLELADAIGPNVGLLVDSFHLHTSGVAPAWMARVPASKVVTVHINDAPAAPVHQLKDSDRVIPGEGVIDLAGFVATLRQIGYAGAVSVELFSETLKAMPPLEAARLAERGCRTFIQR